MVSLPSRQSMAVLIWVCINVVQFTQTNAFCRSTKHAYLSSAMSKFRYDSILSITFASSFPFLFQFETDLQLYPQLSFRSFQVQGDSVARGPKLLSIKIMLLR